MNKKGGTGPALGTVLSFLLLGVLAAVVIGFMLKGFAKPVNKMTTCEEEYCVSAADGCQGTERPNDNRLCKNEELICCMTPEERIGMKKPNQTNSGLPPGNTSVILPNATLVAGNIYIKPGESSAESLVGVSKSLKAGLSYTFKINVDGDFGKCKIKVLDAETSSSVSESWIVGAGEFADCKTVKELVLTPGIYQVNKQYRVEVDMLDGSKPAVKTTVTNIIVTS